MAAVVELVESMSELHLDSLLRHTNIELPLHVLPRGHTESVLGETYCSTHSKRAMVSIYLHYPSEPFMMVNSYISWEEDGKGRGV